MTFLPMCSAASSAASNLKADASIRLRLVWNGNILRQIPVYSGNMPVDTVKVLRLERMRPTRESNADAPATGEAAPELKTRTFRGTHPLIVAAEQEHFPNADHYGERHHVVDRLVEIRFRSVFRHAVVAQHILQRELDEIPVVGILLAVRAGRNDRHRRLQDGEQVIRVVRIGDVVVRHAAKRGTVNIVHHPAEFDVLDPLPSPVTGPDGILNIAEIGVAGGAVANDGNGGPIW